MGIAGAAWATIIGQIASCVVALTYIPRFKHIHLKLGHFRPRARVCLTIASLGLSNSFNQLAITLVQIVLNNSLTYYGALSVYGSEIPLASAGIVMKTNAYCLRLLSVSPRELSRLLVLIMVPENMTVCGIFTGWRFSVILLFR